MTIATPGVAPLADELAGVLDEEIALLTVRRSQLQKLSRVLLERDEHATEQLLGEMEQAERLQADCDLKLRALRNALANATGCRPEDLRLARLLASLPEPVRAALDYRRQQVLLLVEEFRRQHLQATMQLLECIKINRMLLEGLFGEGASVTTYDMHGTAARGLGSGLVDAEL